MYATQFVQDTEDSCELMEKGVDFCPLCAYQNDNIIQNIAKVEASLVGKIDNKQIYTVICDMYRKHVEPLKRQGKKINGFGRKNLRGTLHPSCSKYNTTDSGRHIVLFQNAEALQEEHSNAEQQQWYRHAEPTVCERICENIQTQIGTGQIFYQPTPQTNGGNIQHTTVCIQLIFMHYINTFL